MTAIEMIVFYSQFPRGGACQARGATWGSTADGQEAEGAGENVARAFTVVSMGRNR